MKIFETDEVKLLRSDRYNYNFNKHNGLFQRWGSTEDEDPEWGLPEIADIEISSGGGVCKGKCKFCYKRNKVFSTPVLFWKREKV